jgi:hypothetical protein
VKGLAAVLMSYSVVLVVLFGLCDSHIRASQMPKSGCNTLVSLAVLLAGRVSVTPTGAAMLAVLVRLPLPVVAVAVTVNVTLPLGASTGITMPVPCISAVVVLPAAGHCEPGDGLPQVTPVIDSPATAGSVKMASLTTAVPLLVATMV